MFSIIPFLSSMVLFIICNQSTYAAPSSKNRQSNLEKKKKPKYLTLKSQHYVELMHIYKM